MKLSSQNGNNNKSSEALVENTGNDCTVSNGTQISFQFRFKYCLEYSLSQVIHNLSKYLWCKHSGTSSNTPSNHWFCYALWLYCLDNLVLFNSTDLPTKTTFMTWNKRHAFQFEFTAHHQIMPRKKQSQLYYTHYYQTHAHIHTTVLTTISQLTVGLKSYKLDSYRDYIITHFNQHRQSNQTKCHHDICLTVRIHT